MHVAIACQSTQRRSRTLQIGELRHAVGEHFRRVKLFQPLAAASAFVGAEAAVLVLMSENKLHSFPKALAGDAFHSPKKLRDLMHFQDSAESFGGTVADRPAVSSVAKTPPAQCR